MDRGMTKNGLLQFNFNTGANWSMTGAAEGTCSSGIYNSSRVNINHDWSSLFAGRRTDASEKENSCKLVSQRFLQKAWRSISTGSVSTWLMLRTTRKRMALNQSCSSGRQSVQRAARALSPNHQHRVFRKIGGVNFIVSREGGCAQHKPFVRRRSGARFLPCQNHPPHPDDLIAAGKLSVGAAR